MSDISEFAVHDLEPQPDTAFQIQYSKRLKLVLSEKSFTKIILLKKHVRAWPRNEISCFNDLCAFFFI